jgi:predicted ribosome quality control (RQC) complex YloA/Tae2 family protein
VQTDWLIVRRLAGELDRATRGARVREAGSLADGRFGLRTGKGVIVIDAFGATPIVTDEREHVLEQTAGWVRAIATALDGLRIDGVRARRGDRLIAFECSSRSRFGVTSGYRLVAELVPRFGNILLLKDDTIVSAAKEFSRAQNARRAITIGDGYEPPPLPEPPAGTFDLAEELTTLAGAGEPGAPAAATRALRSRVGLVPRLIAESLVVEAASAVRAGAAAQQLAVLCVARAQAVTESTEGEPAAFGDVFCYWEGDRLAAAHVVPLAQYAHLRSTREASLLEVLSRSLGGASSERADSAFRQRRAALAARVAKRRGALEHERLTLLRERDDAESRDDLRSAGELLYAHLDVVAPGASTFVPPSAPERTIVLDPELDAKANAAAIFKRYRKAVAKLDHVAARLEVLENDERFAAELAWELERADGDTLADVAESVDRLEHRRPSATRGREVRRKPIAVRTAADARIYVGRSPRGNADLTFRIARPDDLWFHARNSPGAHVVLHLDSERAATSEELERAASLAAFHSKARASEKVAVDYTERKFVRRQKNAPPGLVWYTNARTLVVAPEPEPAGVAG